MSFSEIESVTPFIDLYAHKEISEQEFIQFLLKAESEYDWHFTLDGNRLQIRGEQQKIVVVFDHTSGIYKISSSPVIKLHSDIQPLIQTSRNVVGISGPARKQVNRKFVMDQLNEIYDKYKPSDTYILTGGYPGGVPLLALEVAMQRGFEVVAVVPQVIFQPSFLDFLQHFVTLIKVGEDWGDETPAFIHSIDELYVFSGGGPWTMLEYQTANNLGKPIHIILPSRDRQDSLQKVNS